MVLGTWHVLMLTPHAFLSSWGLVAAQDLEQFVLFLGFLVLVCFSKAMRVAVI